MIKSFFFLLFSIFISYASLAQSTAQQELEKQRLELKREIEQTQELLDKNKKTSKVLKWLNAFSVYGIVKIKVFKN